MTTEKKLMWKDESAIEQLTDTLGEGLEILNSINKEFKLLKVGELRTEDLRSLVNGEDFLREWLVKDAPREMEIGGIKVGVDLRKIVELPADRTAFLNGCNELLTYVRSNRGHSNIYKYYEVDNKNNIIFSKTNVDTLLQQYHYYAKTPKEIEFYEVAQKMCDVANEVVSWDKGRVFGKPFIDTDKMKFITFNNSSNSYKVNAKQILASASMYQ